VLRHVLEVVVQSHVYAGLLLFLGGYVVVSSLYWIAASLVFWRHREAAAADFYELDEEPPVSVLVAAHDEEAVIADTIRHLRAVDWPEVEIVVVDDARRTRPRRSSASSLGPVRPAPSPGRSSGSAAPKEAAA
jgi:cellulose synthase/poly-beta-1,6-N-acetylglucosamine synthase-like glycosyltransferase